MSSGNNSNGNSKSWVQIVVAVIGAIALIAVAYLQFIYPHPKEESKRFVGRVIEAKTEKHIRNAKISLELQDAPPVVYTDSEGIFSFPLKNFSSQVRIRVEADGYEKFDRLVNPSSKSGIEEIQLVPVQPESTPTFSSPSWTSREKFTIVGTWLVFDIVMIFFNKINQWCSIQSHNLTM